MKRSVIVEMFVANDEIDPGKSTEYLCQLTADQLGLEAMDVYDALAAEYDRDQCPECGKKVKRGGIAQHMGAKHPELTTSA
jgi:hypothetical protein